MKIAATSITLDRAELAALLLTASTDEYRVNLCQVHVDPARGVAVTTDGHRVTVASVHGERTDAPAVGLPAALLRAALKAAAKYDAIRIAWDDPTKNYPGGVPCTATVGELPVDSETFMPGASTRAGVLSSATFPPWRVVWPAALHPVSVPCSVSPYYLADALTALAKLQGKHACVTCYGPAKGTATRDYTADQAAQLSPVVFRGDDAERGTTWRILVMPMRADVAASGDEGWRIEPAPAPVAEGPAIVADAPAGDAAANVVPIRKKGGRARKTA